jgi:hypothetical protein
VITRSLARLERMVPPAMIMLTMPGVRHGNGEPLGHGGPGASQQPVGKAQTDERCVDQCEQQ